MESGAIADDQITASSEDYSLKITCCRPWHARFNHGTAWRPSRNETNPNRWIRIDFRKNRTVTGLITQGGNAGAAYVKTVYIKYERPAGSGNLQYVSDIAGGIKVSLDRNLCRQNLNRFLVHNLF